MYQLNVRETVKNLREEGYSYNYISKLTSIPKATLSDWLSKLPYTPNEYTIDAIGKSRAAAGLRKNQLKQESLNKALSQATKDIGKLSKRDLFMLGLGVYIGEGCKTHNLIRIVNANPDIIRLSVRWFKEICGVKLGNFRLRLHVYPDNNQEECINFWSKNTGIPKSQFQPTYIDIRINKNKIKTGKLPYGTAHLTVIKLDDVKLGVKLHRLIVAWMNRVLGIIYISAGLIFIKYALAFFLSEQWLKQGRLSEEPSPFVFSLVHDELPPHL